jgi:hypothetical protein
MTPSKGNTTLQVRLEPGIHARLAEVAGKGTAGQLSGPAHFARRLLYLALDKQPPAHYGQTKDVDELEQMVRELEERETRGGAAVAQTQDDALELLTADEIDAVDKVRLYAILGRLWLIEPEES